jgi:hypothetical protein
MEPKLASDSAWTSAKKPKLNLYIGEDIPKPAVNSSMNLQTEQER